MHQVLKYLKVDVAAMTTANLSEEALAIQTVSSFNQCVWEVKFGNVDLCFGSSWDSKTICDFLIQLLGVTI